MNPDWVEQIQGLSVGWTQLEADKDDPTRNRTDRLRLLGNGVVRQTAEKAYITLTNKLNEKEVDKK